MKTIEPVKGLTYRIKQQGKKFYPQWRYGIRTMWSWENVTDYYSNFIELNKIDTEFDFMHSPSNWTMYFYDKEVAQKYINDVLKPKHFDKYYKKIINVE